MKKLLEIFSAGIEDTKILSNQLRVKSSFLKEYQFAVKKRLLLEENICIILFTFFQKHFLKIESLTVLEFQSFKTCK